LPVDEFPVRPGRDNDAMPLALEVLTCEAGMHPGLVAPDVEPLVEELLPVEPFEIGEESVRQVDLP